MSETEYVPLNTAIPATEDEARLRLLRAQITLAEMQAAQIYKDAVGPYDLTFDECLDDVRGFTVGVAAPGHQVEEHKVKVPSPLHTEYELARIAVKHLADRILSLDGTERELGSYRSITTELYETYVGEILRHLELVYKMTPEAEAA